MTRSTLKNLLPLVGLDATYIDEFEFRLQILVDRHNVRNRTSTDACDRVSLKPWAPDVVIAFARLKRPDVWYRSSMRLARPSGRLSYIGSRIVNVRSPV